MSERIFEDADVASAWNGNADRWTDSVRAGFDLYRELYTLPAFLKFMPQIKGLRVIDLGCGEGSITRRFARLGGEVTGIDLSQELIERARVEEACEPLGIRYEVCSFSRIEISKEGCYDRALSTMAFMDGADFDLAMEETHRILAPNGMLCFSILHPCFITRAVEWVRAGDGAYGGLKVGQYFDRSHYVEHWRFNKHPAAKRLQPFEILRLPRTLSDYVNAVCGAGFRIMEIDEPRPEKSVCREHAWLSRWREHAPMVLFIKAVKA